ncbi:MAG: YciI family protein [Planctomycetota bacterium]
MKYAVLIYESPEQLARDPQDPESAAYWGAYAAYTEALVKADVMAGGEGLEPPHTAATVRLKDGAPVVQDGPFADTHEQLGGFYLIEAEDRDAALAWAARCPAADGGAVEVRPVMVMDA